MTSSILTFNGWYWVEASGIIEKLLIEHGGNPIPSSLARFIVGIGTDDSDFRSDDTDRLYYYRTVNGLEKRRKVVAFRDETTKTEAEGEIENYGKFKLSLDAMDKRILESGDDFVQSVIEARRFLSRLFDFHYEEECNEMLPSWND